MSARIRAVVFDYGGVLTTPTKESITAWQRADGIRPESFTAVLKEWLGRDAAPGTPVHRLETGELSIAEFDRLLAARLETYDGTPVDPVGVLDRLFARMRPDPVMFDLVAEVRAAGLRVALLSNSWGNTYPRELIDDLFSPVVISGEVGLRKPDPEIYRLALQRLGLAGESCVFVDDAEPNLRGAESVGLRSVLHTTPTATRAALARHIPELATSSGATA